MTPEPWNKHTPGDPMPCKCGESVVEVKVQSAGGRFFVKVAGEYNWGRNPDFPDYEITDWRFVERKGEDVIQRCAECDCEGGSSECNWIKSGPDMQYYYKNNACPAEYSQAENCICWHDEGKGPFPDLKNGDAIPMAYNSAVGLTWRVAPHPAPVEALNDPYAALEWDEDDTATVVLETPGKPEWVRDDDMVRFHVPSYFGRVDAFYCHWKLVFAFQIKRRPVLTAADPQLLAVLYAATDDEANAIRSAAHRANIEVPE